MKRMQGSKQFLTAMGILIAITTNAEAKVAAMDAVSGEPIQAETLISSHGKKRVLVDQTNIRIEMAPYSIGEFMHDGTFKLLRGSAVLEASGERVAQTNSARVDFAGSVVLSFDHKEKSTSAFVVEGEARLKNPHESDVSLRLDRGRGASMVLGDVYPSLIRDISPGQVETWLKGYAWESADIKRFTTAFASAAGRGPAVVAHSEKIEENPTGVRLEDYFAAVDEDRPDLYEQRFGLKSDAEKFADKIVETAKVERKIASTKTIDPEEAALIALPSKPQIELDMGFPEVFASSEAARADVEKQLREERGQKRAPERKLASVRQAVAHTAPVRKRLHSDDDISYALERLTSLRQERQNAQRLRSGVPEYLPAGGGRAPASIESPIPDPVYDFSENF